MNELLFFLAFPIAVIVISVALERILKFPLLVSGIIFSIFLILTFAVYDTWFFVYTIVYAIISYLTAIIYKNLAENCEHISQNNFAEETINNDSTNKCRRSRYLR